MVSGKVLGMGGNAEGDDMSKRDTYMRIAVCPYFKSAYERTIHCEGLLPGTDLRSSFPTYHACRTSIKTTCADRERCRECLIFKAETKK